MFVVDDSEVKAERVVKDGVKKEQVCVSCVFHVCFMCVSCVFHVCFMQMLDDAESRAKRDREDALQRALKDMMNGELEVKRFSFACV